MVGDSGVTVVLIVDMIQKYWGQRLTFRSCAWVKTNEQVESYISYTVSREAFGVQPQGPIQGLDWMLQQAKVTLFVRCLRVNELSHMYAVSSKSLSSSTSVLFLLS